MSGSLPDLSGGREIDFEVSSRPFSTMLKHEIAPVNRVGHPKLTLFRDVAFAMMLWQRCFVRVCSGWVKNSFENRLLPKLDSVKMQSPWATTAIAREYLRLKSICVGMYNPSASWMFQGSDWNETTSCANSRIIRDSFLHVHNHREPGARVRGARLPVRVVKVYLKMALPSVSVNCLIKASLPRPK